MTATPQSELDSRLATLAKAAGEREPAEGEELPDPIQSPADADAIRAFIGAYDPNTLTETPPADDSTLSTGTCNTYLNRLTEAARHITLTTADASDVNEFLGDLKGDLHDSTVHSHSTALRKFYTFHDFGPDPGDVARIDTSNGSTFDPDDVLTRDEIHAMLDAADNPRDKAVFALLVFTGMRNNMVRTLRVGDVNPQAGSSGKWSVPDETDGLKGVEKHGQKRPLLGAKGPVRDWLSYHPASDDPDAYLITGRPKYGKADPTEKVAGSTVRRIVYRLADAADKPAIDRKPTHPHMMRHNFVTVCKRDYDLADETVKFLIGHSPASKVMETTYAHLSDADHTERAEVAAGMRDPEDDASPLTPPACPTCGNPLSAGAKACERCGDVFTPDAKALEHAAEEIRQDVTDKALDGEFSDAERRAARAIRAAVDDPAALAEELDLDVGE